MKYFACDEIPWTGTLPYLVTYSDIRYNVFFWPLYQRF